MNNTQTKTKRFEHLVIGEFCRLYGGGQIYVKIMPIVDKWGNAFNVCNITKGHLTEIKSHSKVYCVEAYDDLKPSTN